MTILANIAIPSFLPHSVATLIGMLVIAGIEGWFVMKGLQLRYAEAYKHALHANWKSTIVGIPVAWLLWIGGLLPVSLGLSAIGLEAHPAVASTAMQTAIFGGMMPTEWMDVGSAAARMVMLIPFWLGSVWIERRTLAKRLPDHDPAPISTAVVRGNLASYSIFLILGVMALANAMADLPHQKNRFRELRERPDAHRRQQGEQTGTGQPAARSRSEAGDPSQPESGERAR